MQKIVYITILSIVLLVLPAFSQEEQSDGSLLTLQDCINRSISSHPDLKQARAGIRKAEAQLGQVRSSYFPQLSFSYGYTASGAQGDYYTDDNGYLVQVDSRSSYTSTLTLRQYITDFGRTANAVKASKESHIMSLCDLTAYENSIVYAVKTAYYDCIAQSELLLANKEYAEASRDHLEQSRAFYKAGTRSKIEVTSSETDLANAELEVSKSDTAYETAKINLFNAMGVSLIDQFELKSNFELPEISQSSDYFIEIAKRQRPEVLKSEANLRAVKARFTAATAEYAPSLSSSARYNWSGSNYPLLRQWSVGLSLDMPIWNGNKTMNAVKEAQANIDSVDAQNERILQNIFADVRKAYLNMTTARHRIDVSKKSLELAQENFRLAQSRYKLGVGSNLEFTDSQVSLLKAKQSQIQALMDYFTSIASLEYSAGISLETATEGN